MNRSYAWLMAVLLFGNSCLLAETDVAKVELTTPRKTYLLGEPVVLDVVLRNATESTIEGCRTPDEYIRIWKSQDGREFIEIKSRGTDANIGLLRATLEPAKPWRYRLQILNDFGQVLDDGTTPGLAFPKPGVYTIKVDLPLIGFVLSSSKVSVPSKYVESNMIEVRINAPQGDDVQVFEALRDQDTRYFLETGDLQSNQELNPGVKVARLLERHPESGYSEGLRDVLISYYRKYLTHRAPENADREVVRRVLGEPDDRFFPDDPRLDGQVVMDFPQPTKLSEALRSLQEQIKVPLSASPYNMLDSVVVASKLTCPLRVGVKAITTPTEWSWVRRGNGYYFYSETLDTSPSARKRYNDLIGPVEAIFPEDKRLNVDIIADFPEPTPIDAVIASYAKQSGAALSASPFFKRCRQYGEKETLNLRSEMSYLARTFRATWERQGEGYVLNAGKESDEEHVPPRPEPPKATSRVGVIVGGLAAVALVVLAFVSRRNHAGRSNETA